MEKSIVFFNCNKQDVNNMHENKNEQTTGTKTIKKIGKTTYEVIVHFNDKSSETMQDKLKRIMLREFRRKSDEKKDDFD